MLNQPCEISLGTLNPDMVPPGGVIEGALMFGSSKQTMRITENPLAQFDDDEEDEVDGDEREEEQRNTTQDSRGLRHT